jgi:hypothetical protein
MLSFDATGDGTQTEAATISLIEILFHAASHPMGKFLTSPGSSLQPISPFIIQII